MDMHLQRKVKSEFGVFSEFKGPQGLLGMTCEHAYDYGDGHWEAKIPEGIFDCVRGKHKLHDGTEFETFEITGVEGHTGLLFHWGNKEKDSDGCVLTGEKIEQLKNQAPMVINSRVTFERFMGLQEGCDRFKLTVQDLLA